METLVESVTTVITAFLNWFTAMSTSLISNPFVALMFGLGIALLVYKLIISLVGKASFRKRGRRR